MADKVWVVWENLGNINVFDNYTHYSDYKPVFQQCQEFEKYCIKSGYTEKYENIDPLRGHITLSMRNKKGRSCDFIANRLPIYNALVRHKRGNNNETYH